MVLLVAQNLVVIHLLTHAIYFRPHRTTLLFLAFTIPPAAVYDPSVYVFNRAAEADLLDVWHGGNVPLFSLFGFFFTFYLALTIGLSLVRRPGESDVSFGRLLAACVVVFVAFGVCLETLNSSLKWWTLQYRGNVLGYLGMWYWRPALAFPLLFSRLLPVPVLRRRAFRASLMWCWILIWDSLLLGPLAGPIWHVFMIAMTFAALAYVAHKFGDHPDLRIPLDALVFDQPQWIFGRASTVN
ncbi:MAG: hypothetical protein IT350_07750 [Deltaproteobacteria bacterium]|nr:hypothetical protein [Deltaproteobacteria bacterium]